MKIIEPYFEILHMADGAEIMRVLELAARNCWKSEDKISDNSAEHLLKHLIKIGHESVLEHISATVRFVCDRGVTHEIVRHRLCSFSQESTRYANYSKEKFGREITVIRPLFWEYGTDAYIEWRNACLDAEDHYLKLLDGGAKAQEARSVLPNSLKADIVVTANIREWIHIFKLRGDKASHPQMRQSILPVLAEFHKRVPVLFDSIYGIHRKDIEG